MFNLPCNDENVGTLRVEHMQGNLHISDLSRSNEHWVDSCGRIPVDEFVNVEWLLGDKVMGVKVNGELRFVSCEFEYIEAFKQPGLAVPVGPQKPGQTGYSICGPVYPAAGRGSTVTVKSLRVTEL